MYLKNKFRDCYKKTKNVIYLYRSLLNGDRDINYCKKRGIEIEEGEIVDYDNTKYKGVKPIGIFEDRFGRCPNKSKKDEKYMLDCLRDWKVCPQEILETIVYVNGWLDLLEFHHTPWKDKRFLYFADNRKVPLTLLTESIHVKDDVFSKWLESIANPSNKGLS